MKKLLKTVILPTAIAMTITGTTYAASFTDVPKDHWAYASVNKLVKDGLVEGYSDGSFKGDKTITRFEMAVVVGKAIDRYEKADESQKKQIDALSAEFAGELNRMGVRVAKVEAKTNTWMGGETRMRFVSDSPSNSNQKLKGSDKFDFRQRLKFWGTINDDVSWTGRLSTGSDKWGSTVAGTTPAATSFSSGSEISLDIMNVTAKHVLGMDSIRAGRSALDFFGTGLMGKPMNVDGVLINNKFGDVQFKGWTGNIKNPTAADNVNAQLTTGQFGFKLSDKLNARTGYYWADINGATGVQNIKAGESYSNSKGWSTSFDYKMGKYTLLGEYISSNLNNAVNLPSNPKGWAVQFSNSQGPAVFYSAVPLVNIGKVGSDAWMVSYRSVDAGALPAGAGGFDTTAVSKPGPTGPGIFPNTTDNLNVLFLAYQKVLAKNVVAALEYQDFKVKDKALSSWTSDNIDKTYMMKLEFFY